MSLKQLLFAGKRQLVGFLELICQELELSDTQFQDAKQKYETVGKWLASGGTIKVYGPRIIPQGSISLGTTVRPIGRDEFDIDLVCKLVYAGAEENQAYIRNIVGDRLRENEIYSKMIEPLNRGWRLNYAKSSRFHLDITPAVMNRFSLNGEVLVTDKELKQWKPSNPEGYVQWFEQHAALRPRLVTGEIEMKTYVQPLPEPAPFKNILKRTVQILKRHRDVYFQKRNSKDVPISIVITTLTAKSYAEAVRTRVYESELDILYDVIANMDKFILIKNVNGRLEYFIPNETSIGENFAEKWNRYPERAKAFFEWQSVAIKDIKHLGLQRGLDSIRVALADSFGEAETIRTFSRYTNSINNARSRSTLRADPLMGLGLTSGIPLRNNTYFGK